MHLHADNCVGQNKNNTMLHYLLWRVMTGLHKSIVLSFLVVGHTKFSPDWCFGLLKCRTRVGCLDDLVQVVDQFAEANVAQLVGTQDGETIVPMYNWTGMFQGRLRKLNHFKQYHHFLFDATTPAVVRYKQESDSQPVDVSLLQDLLWSPSPTDKPDRVVSTGLSHERQCYLYNSLPRRGSG